MHGKVGAHKRRFTWLRLNLFVVTLNRSVSEGLLGLQSVRPSPFPVACLFCLLCFLLGPHVHGNTLIYFQSFDILVGSGGGRVVKLLVRGSIPGLATWISEIGYLLLPIRDMAEIPLKRRKSSIQPTNLTFWRCGLSRPTFMFYFEQHSGFGIHIPEYCIIRINIWKRSDFAWLLFG